MAGMYGCFKGRNSDSAAMASGPPDVMANQEPAEVQEECSGKKKSKFQTFKKFFARKKRKEPSAAGADAGLKGSQSSDNVSKTSENNTLTRSEKDKGSGSKISLGSKALSHDSVFVSDSSEANEALGASQDSIHGKVKSLQLQLKQAIRLGSPPSLMCVKRTEDAGTMSEDDGLPCSPPEYTTLHTVMNQAQRNSSISLEGIESDDDQLSCAASSRAMSPLVVPGDFSQPASPFACLDNSAAKHKLGLRHKACNKRKPVSRLEVKGEGDSVVDEMLNTSITEALEEQDQPRTEAVSFDELKPKVEREEEEEEKEKEEVEEVEEEEGKEQPQHSRESLLRDKKEGEDESEAEQDVSQSPYTSSPSELSLSEEEEEEEEAPDGGPLPSSKPSSRASSLDSPSVTPELPAGPREYLLDPPGTAYGAEENRAQGELALRVEEDGVRENREEESSFLEEVLSSLKTPLSSCSLGVEAEGVVLEVKEEEEEEEEMKEKEKEEEEKEEEEEEVEDGEEVKEGEAGEDEPCGYQAAPSGSLLLDRTTEEEEEVSAPSHEEEMAPTEEEEKEEEEEEEEETAKEEEELVVERFTQHVQEEEEEAEEVKPEEENDMFKTDIQTQEEGRGEESERDEEEDEAIELETEPEVEEEGREKREEEEEEVEAKELRVEEAEEAIEEEREDLEEMTEAFPDEASVEVGLATSLHEEEADEGVDAVAEGDAVSASDDETPTELGEQELAEVQEGQEDSEMAEEGVEIDRPEQKSDQEEEANPPDVDETERESVEMSHFVAQTEAAEQATVPSKLPSLSLPESHEDTQSQETGTVSPSKTSTTTLHINLVSPSSEKATSFFQQSPTAADIEENVTKSPSAAEEQTAGEEGAEAEEEVEEEKQSVIREEEEEGAAPPAPVEGTVNKPSISSDQNKVRFTIAPAWQRSQSLSPPSSPPACVPSAVTGPGGEEVEATTNKDPAVKAEPEPSSPKVELVLSPVRARSAGSTAAKPQSIAATYPSSVKPQTSAAAAAASTEESSVVVEGNPDNPFGVRLRKTSALHRFGSEEENAESPIESPVQPTSCKPEPPQPISVKPSVSQPISSKPALPKKPDVHGDSGGKAKRISDPATARGVSGGSDSPSWISVAKQKQKIYKENSMDEITVKKEEQERKPSLPMYVSSAASREQSNKPAESTSKVSSLEINKPSASVEKEARRGLSPPAPVPPQPSKAHSLPCPVPPKPQVPPATTKPPPQPNPAQRSLSPPTPVPVLQKSPSCTSPPPPPTSPPSSKSPQPQTTTAASAPFSSRTAPDKSGSRAPGLPGQTPSSQRGLPPPALPQDEPPWMALAKKKAKAWSEMPQIVQ